MATNGRNSGGNRRPRHSGRSIRSRDIVRFVIGLLAFIGLGRFYKREPSRNSIMQPVNNPEQPARHDGIPENPEIKHESSDVRVRPIVLAGVVLLVGAIAGHLILWGFFVFLQSQQAQADVPSPPFQVEREPVAAPPLQADPEGDMEQALAAEHERLNSYGWIDQGAGTVHIPIDQAMNLVIEQNLLPVRPEGVADEEAPGFEQGRELDSEGGQEVEGVPLIEATVEPAIEATPEPAGDVTPQPEGTATPDGVIEPPVQTEAAPTEE